MPHVLIVADGRFIRQAWDLNPEHSCAWFRRHVKCPILPLGPDKSGTQRTLLLMRSSRAAASGSDFRWLRGWFSPARPTSVLCNRATSGALFVLDDCWNVVQLPTTLESKRIQPTLEQLIKSYVSRFGCSVVNCSHHNNLMKQKARMDGFNKR